MPTGLDKVKDVITKGGSGFDPLTEIPILYGALTSTENKLVAISKAAASIALWRLIPMSVALSYSLMGVQGVIKSIVRESGALEAAWQKLSRMKVYQNQLAPLTKGIKEARDKLAELIKWSNSSPFKIGEAVGAYRALNILSGGALKTADSLNMASSAAKASGKTLDEAAYSIGSFYKGLKDGQPVSQAAAELQGMGVISQKAARDLQQLQDGGASFAQIWEAAGKMIKQGSGNTEDMGDDLDVLSKKLGVVKNDMLAGFGEGFLESERNAMRNSIAITEALIPVMKKLGQTLGAVVSVGENLGSWIVKVITGNKTLMASIDLVSKALVLLGVGVAIKGFYSMIMMAGGATKALWSYGASAKAAALANELLTTSALQTAAAEEAALIASEELAAGHMAEAASAKAAAVAQASMAKGNLVLAESLQFVGKGALSAAMGVGRFIAGLVFGPVGVMIAVVAMLSKAWSDFAEANEAKKATDEIVKGNKEAIDAIDDHLESINNLEDAYKALHEALSKVVEAKSKATKHDPEDEKENWVDTVLNTISSAGHHMPGSTPGMGDESDNGFVDTWRKRRQEKRDAKKNARESDENTVKEAERAREAAYAAINSGKFQSQGMKDVTAQKAQRELTLNEMEKSQFLERTHGMGKVDTLRKFAGSEQSKYEQGEGMAEARARFNAQSDAINSDETLSSTEKAERIAKTAWGAKGQGGALIRSEQHAREVRARGDIPGADALDLKNAMTKEDIENGRGKHQENAKSLAFQADQEERAVALKQIGLNAAKEEAALRSEGLKREMESTNIALKKLEAEKAFAESQGDDEAAQEAQNQIDAARQQWDYSLKRARLTEIGLEAAKEEAALRSEGFEKEQDIADIKINALEQEKEEANKVGDTDASADIQNRIDGLRQEIEMTKKRAQIERDADSAHLHILELETESRHAAIMGRFAESDVMHKQSQEEDDAQRNKESLRAKQLRGDEDAEAQVAREQAQREAARESKRDEFRQSRGRELEEQKLELSGKKGSGEKVDHMRMTDAFRSARKEAMDSGIYGEEATRYAADKVKADSTFAIRNAAKDNVVVSSLARIGGGGNVAPGIDVLKEEARRHTQLLQIIAENTGRDGDIKIQ